MRKESPRQTDRLPMPVTTFTKSANVGTARLRTAMRRQAKEDSREPSSSAERGISGSSEQAQSRWKKLQRRIQSMMAVLREEFGQLETDLQAANRSSARARRDRIEGLKR